MIDRELVVFNAQQPASHTAELDILSGMDGALRNDCSFDFHLLPIPFQATCCSDNGRAVNSSLGEFRLDLLVLWSAITRCSIGGYYRLGSFASLPYSVVLVSESIFRCYLDSLYAMDILRDLSELRVLQVKLMTRQRSF